MSLLDSPPDPRSRSRTASLPFLSADIRHLDIRRELAAQRENNFPKILSHLPPLGKHGARSELHQSGKLQERELSELSKWLEGYLTTHSIHPISVKGGSPLGGLVWFGGRANVKIQNVSRGRIVRQLQAPKKAGFLINYKPLESLHKWRYGSPVCC